MSPTRRAGTTAEPSLSTCTGTESRIVSSRSVPVTVSRPSATSSRTPDSTGNVPDRLRRRTPGRRQRIGQDLSFAAELHSVALLPMR